MTLKDGKCQCGHPANEHARINLGATGEEVEHPSACLLCECKHFNEKIEAVTPEVLLEMIAVETSIRQDYKRAESKPADDCICARSLPEGAETLTFRKDSLASLPDTYHNSEWATKLLATKLSSSELYNLAVWLQNAAQTARYMIQDRQIRERIQSAESQPKTHRSTLEESREPEHFTRPARKQAEKPAAKSLDELLKGLI